MQLWGQPLSRATIGTAATSCVLFGWQGSKTGYSHLLRFNATGSDISCNPEVFQRVYVHFLVDEIPTAGLGETIEALHSIVDFYQPTPQRLLPAPTKSSNARVVGRTQRPTMILPTE